MKVECAGCGDDCSHAYATWRGDPCHVMCIPQPPKKRTVDPRDPDPSRPGIFRDHNCWRCKDGRAACVTGGSRGCPYPHARND